MSDPIKHVVLLMLENHSFDEMLGCYQSIYSGLDGVDPKALPRANMDEQGKPYYQNPKNTLFMRFDPKHEHPDVMTQIDNNNGGFIRDFLKTYPSSTPQDRGNIMGYYEHGFLPALHALADDFTICDRWFSSLPGPTWPNRFFALSGTSSGKVTMPEGLEHPHIETILSQTQVTIFDRLNETQRSWKIYYYDFPSSLVFRSLRQGHNLAHFEHIDNFFAKTDARLNEADFPEFVFIEPKYFGVDQNDDHPPHNLMKAEKLIADVYNAIRSNDSLWETTLLVVVFDEHGGFYDHVPPPAAVAPDGKTDEYDFTRLGVRVPALLVSPWVGRGVLHQQFDHTSLLKYLIDKWGLGPLGLRATQANSIEIALKEPEPRTDTVGFIRIPFGDLIKSDSAANEFMPTAHHEAIHVLANVIEQELKGAEPKLAAGAVGFAAKASRWWQLSSGWLAKRMHNLGDMFSRASNRPAERSTNIVQNLFVAMKGEE